MDSFELNKIIGAVLGTLLFVMGVGFLAEALYTPLENGPGYNLPEPEPLALADAGPDEPEVPLGVLLASASAENGAADVRKCQSCHSFEQGGPNKQGPNLYETVGRVIGSHPDFAYSEPFLALQAEGRTWTYEELNAFIASPRTHVPGTKMTFAGVRTGEERADILAYLQTLAAAPVPFPEAEAPVAESGDDLVEPTQNSQPVDVIETPSETMGESSVVGTPTGSGTGVEPEQGETVAAPELAPNATPAGGDGSPATETPANPLAPPAEPAPEAPVSTQAPAMTQVPAMTPWLPSNALTPAIAAP